MTPTSTPTPAGNGGNGNGGNGGGNGGGGEPHVCNDAKPASPTDLTAVLGPGAGEVSLSWTAPAEPYSYFVLAYNDSPDWPPKWGNPDIGKATNFVVSGLGGGDYWFWVRAQNGCMPGDFVGPVSPGRLAGAPAVGPAPGFEEGVLGEQIEENGEIAGVDTEEKPVCPWWLKLLFLEFLLVSFYWWWAHRKTFRTGEEAKFTWRVPLVLAVLAYIGDHFIAHRFYTPSRWCSWMWLWVILAAVLPAIIGRFLLARKKA